MRVVDVGIGDGLLWLVEIMEDMKDIDYVVLSYCWGLVQFFIMIKVILLNRFEGILWEDIFKILYEVIEFV